MCLEMRSHVELGNNCVRVYVAHRIYDHIYIFTGSCEMCGQYTEHAAGGAVRRRRSPGDSKQIHTQFTLIIERRTHKHIHFYDFNQPLFTSQRMLYIHPKYTLNQHAALLQYCEMLAHVSTHIYTLGYTLPNVYVHYKHTFSKCQLL